MADAVVAPNDHVDGWGVNPERDHAQLLASQLAVADLGATVSIAPGPAPTNEDLLRCFLRQFGYDRASGLNRDLRLKTRPQTVTKILDGAPRDSAEHLHRLHEDLNAVAPLLRELLQVIAAIGTHDRPALAKVRDRYNALLADLQLTTLPYLCGRCSVPVFRREGPRYCSDACQNLCKANQFYRKSGKAKRQAARRVARQEQEQRDLRQRDLVAALKKMESEPPPGVLGLLGLPKRRRE